jgi:hypothetical protein
VATVPGVNTWSAGSILTAAQLNTYVSAAVAFLINRPVFQGRQTVTQSLTSGVSTPAILDTEDIDNDNMHSNTTNPTRATAQTAGRFQVSGGVGWLANATARKGCWWLVNGAAVNGSSAVGPSSASLTTTNASRVRTVFLNVGDYVELLAYQEIGGALSTNVGTFDQSSMTVRWVGTT